MIRLFVPTPAICCSVLPLCPPWLLAIVSAPRVLQVYTLLIDAFDM